MGKKILRQLTDLQETNKAYARFVPNDFLDHLDKDSILDMELGDHVERKMSVLFSDIRDFTTISESMAPEENFRFVNSILSRIGPIIRNHSGFIDKYIGDAVMAFFGAPVPFADHPDKAAAASLAMLDVLDELLAALADHPVTRDVQDLRLGFFQFGLRGLADARHLQHPVAVAGGDRRCHAADLGLDPAEVQRAATALAGGDADRERRYPRHPP